MFYTYGTRKLLTCIHKVNWMKGRYVADLAGRVIMILKRVSSKYVLRMCIGINWFSVEF